MKLQHLSIIFVIIILPISLVLSAYIQAQATTLSTQIEYDSRLISATYDAIKAFQLNTINNTTSNVSDSKIRDIEASANTFFNSLGTSFGLVGSGIDTLKSYVPALVYTMYDGYYIYCPFLNTNGLDIDDDGEWIYGLKPYIYYSCEYRDGSNDVVINYSLDNYITVEGWIDGEYVKKSGYLQDKYKTETYTGSLGSPSNPKYITYVYSGEFNRNVLGIIEEFEGGSEGSSSIICSDGYETIYQRFPGYEDELPCIKENGTTYYLDENNEQVIYLLNGTVAVQASKNLDETTYNEYVEKIKYNSSAILYYKEAAEFTAWAYENLDWVTSSCAVDVTLTDGLGDTKIFYKDSDTFIEYDNSNFNVHRLAVIRNSIETSLSAAISAYNKYNGSNNSTDFQMPKLKEDEWSLILNNVSLISFLQGVYTNGSLYNGYAIVTNSVTKEVVQPESIYIEIDGSEYHKITDKSLANLSSGSYTTIKGILNIDLERRSYTDSSGTTIYYYPEESYACYNCIVNQTNVVSLQKYQYSTSLEKDEYYDGGYYEYVDSLSNKELIEAFYIALGRERYGMNRVT